MKKIILILSVAILSINSIKAQWGQVNNGITNLTSGARLLGSSNTYLFSGTLGGGKMYRTNDNGNNWTEIQPPVTSNVPESGYFFSGKYFSGLNSSMDCIFYTTDNGTTWNSVTGGPQTTVVRGFESLLTTVFAYTSNKGIFRSTDGGNNWNQDTIGLTNLNVSDMETINGKLIAATIGGGIYISTDNGSTWVQSNTGIASGDLNAKIVWRMGTSLYYTAQGGGSYSSSDEGVNWSTWVKPAVMGLDPMEIYRNGTNLYMEARHFSGGLRDSIYLSSNEGVTWINITDNLSATDLNASGITEFGGDVFIAYNISSPGLGIYRKGISTSIENITINNTVALYPNPFQHQLNLSKQVLSIRVYNMIGKEVMFLTHRSKTVKLSHLDNGIYILELE